MVEQEAVKSSRRVKQGTVIANKMNKTVVVGVKRKFLHPRYGKVIVRQKKYYAHHENQNSLQVGDEVTIVETRPISKLKRWRVIAEHKETKE